MIDIILTIFLGSLASFAAFLSCMAIWRVNPVYDSFKIDKEKNDAGDIRAYSATSDLSEGATLWLSVNIRQQELALTEESATVAGSYINFERNWDGMQSCNKIFLN